MSQPENEEHEMPPATSAVVRPSSRWLAAESFPVANWPVQRWAGDNCHEQVDQVVIEEPFEVRLNGHSLAAIMRTPGYSLESDRELALGFLLSEGIITSLDQVADITRVIDQDGLPAENALDVRLKELPPGLFNTPEDGQPARFERRFMVASSCGLCGKNSIQEVCRHLPPLASDDFRVSARTLYSLPDLLRGAQKIFEATGGLHAAGLFDKDGRLRAVREDIGRHNGVDRLLGRMALDHQFPIPNYILMVSGRISFEIVQKALVGRIPIIAAVSAPSHLALELAQDSHITVIGFLRQQTFNCYTWPERIID